MMLDPVRGITATLAALAGGVWAATAMAAWSGRGKRLQVPGIAAASAALVICLALVLTGLGHPERVFGAFQNFRSPITQKLLAILIAGSVLAACLKRLLGKQTMSKGLCAVSLLLSILLVVAFSDPYLLTLRTERSVLLTILACLALAAFSGAVVAHFLNRWTDKDKQIHKITARAVFVGFGVLVMILATYVFLILNAPPPPPMLDSVM